MHNVGWDLWNMVKSLLLAMDGVYDFLTTWILEVAQFEIFGLIIWEEFSFTPLGAIGQVIIFLLMVTLVSLFIPGN